MGVSPTDKKLRIDNDLKLTKRTVILYYMNILNPVVLTTLYKKVNIFYFIFMITV